jgi:alkylated DNA repair dioxygenase AlkB
VERQLSLLAGGTIGCTGAPVERHHLDERSWVDVARGWLSGADEAFDRMVDGLTWRHGRRPMYGRLVDEPRLTASCPADDPAAPEPVREVADALEDRYRRPLRHLWANWYRSGDDAVAWHGDRVALGETDPLVAIVSLGGPRAFLLRPKGGGPARRHVLHSGDLLVMGGSCQHDWEHAVPRARGGPPRISLTYRVPSRYLVDRSTVYRSTG